MLAGKCLYNKIAAHLKHTDTQHPSCILTPKPVLIIVLRRQSLDSVRHKIVALNSLAPRHTHAHRSHHKHTYTHRRITMSENAAAMFAEQNPVNRSDFSLIDDHIDASVGNSPKNEGHQMFLQVVELLRLEEEVRIVFYLFYFFIFILGEWGLTLSNANNALNVPIHSHTENASVQENAGGFGLPH